MTLDTLPLIVLCALLAVAAAALAAIVLRRVANAQRERAALRRALAASSDWWWRAGPDLKILEAERGRAGLPGFDPEALRGNPPWQLGPAPPNLPAPPAIAQAVLSRLPFHDIEVEVPVQGASAPVLWLSGAPVFSPTGRFSGYAGVATLTGGRATGADGAEALRTRLRQLEAELQTRIQRHELTVRELDSFAYSVSHDLRAPLRVIDGFTQIVLEDYGARLDTLGCEHLKRIAAASGRMNSMIDTLLAMSRMTGRELQFERVDLSETARQLVDELRAAEPQRKLEIVVQPGLSIEGDGTLLRMVLQNLLGNAFKFSAKTREARIEFGRRPDGDHAFFVRDNGAGFDMRFADRLFGVFQRLHSQSEFAGTGVGLATVQRIVRRHSGHIWAESEPGKGATFFFTMWDRGPRPAESS